MTEVIDRVGEVLKRYGTGHSNLIMILQDIQATLRYIPAEAVDHLSRQLDIPRSQIYSVASFYKGLSLVERGKHQIDVCMGTACHVRGAGLLVDKLAHDLNVAPGGTTADKEATLTTVNCVGACAMGPVVVIDGDYFGNMNVTRLSRTVEKSCSGDGSCRETAVRPEDQKPVRPAQHLGSPADLAGARASLSTGIPSDAPRILVCAGTGCIANGALKVAEQLEKELASQGAELPVELMVKRTGCHGFCEQGPLVVFHPQGTFYTKVKPRQVGEIIEKTALTGEVIEKYLYQIPDTKKYLEDYRLVPFYAGQQRNVLRNIGRIDPEDIGDCIARGGYEALGKVLSTMQPGDVIDEVERSGLRGCGGGGFSTGRKWRSCVRAGGEKRYLLCNGDEGDPGAFMDRSIMEGDPHAVLEGMLIGAYAIGADEGFIYVRDEYPLAVARLQRAIRDAEEWGLLGDRILGTDFSFHIRISRGGGSFVCGESTALMQSITGKVGEPRAKYVRSVERGLYDKPTVLNNVETLANIPLIIDRGAEWFASTGTEKSKGTKAFALVGKVNNTGLVEVPMGTRLRTIIYDIGGGILDGRPFKAVQTGGPSGGCLPESKLDLPVDFDTLQAEGSMMGSGGMIVMDDTTCMVDVARYFTTFLTEESCGKCAACRLGLEQLQGILERICEGKGAPEDMGRMERLFDTLDGGSLCGLGKSAANPVRSTLKYFQDEYEAHIRDQRCPAGVCRELITYSVIDENCTGCTLCKKECPQGAITGEKKEVHRIDPALCDHCGMCRAVCKLDAILAE